MKDTVECINGDITGKTLAKRTARNTVGGGCSVGGAALGQVLIPLPFVGAAVGGFFGSMLGKGVSSLCGLYSEDD